MKDKGMLGLRRTEIVLRIGIPSTMSKVQGLRTRKCSCWLEE